MAPTRAPFRRASGAVLAVLLLGGDAAAVGDASHELVGGAELLFEARRDGLVSAQDDPAAVVTAGNRSFVVGRTRSAGAGRFLILARDVSSGATLWKATAGDDLARATAAALSPDGATLFVTGTIASPPDFEPDVLSIAFDAASGAELWSTRHVLPMGRRADVAAVAVGDDGGGPRVFVAATERGAGATDADYLVLGYDGDSGAPLWTDVVDGPDALADRATASQMVPDGSQLLVTGTSAGATTGDDYLTIAYDPATGARNWTQRHTGPGAGAGSSDAPTALAVAPAGSLVVVTGAASSTDETIAYDLATGTPLWSAPFVDQGLSIAVGPGGLQVYVTGVERGFAPNDDDAVTVCYHGFNGAVLWTTRFDSGDHDRPVASAVSPNGARLFVTGTRIFDNSSSNQFTVAYETLVGGEPWRAEFGGPGDRRDDAKGLAISDDGLTLFAAGSSTQVGQATDFAVVDYDAASGAELAQTLNDEVGGGFDDVRDLAVGPKGKALYSAASAGFFGTYSDTTAWDGATGAELWTSRFVTSEGFEGGGERIVVDPDETLVAVLARSDDDAHVVGYRASDGLELWRVVRDAYASDAPGALAFAPNGSRVFVALGRAAAPPAADWGVLALDAASGALAWERTFDAAGLADVPRRVVASPSGNRVFVVGGSTDAGVGGDDLFAVAYDAAGGAELWTARHAGPLVGGAGLDESAEHADVDAGGATLFVGANARDGSGVVQAHVVVALEASNGSELWSAPSPAGEELAALRVAPDGGRVFLAAHTTPDDPESSDVVVYALDGATGALVWREVLDTGTGDRARDLALDPDGVTLYVTGIRDATAGFGGVAGGDVHTRALDAETGALLWQAAYDGPGLGDDQPTRVALDSAGQRVLVAGRSDGDQSASDALLVAYGRPSLAAGPPAVALAAGGPHELFLRGDAARAFWIYWMLGSAAGTSPGQLLPNGVVLPLQPDMFFDITVRKPLATVFEGYLGLLDGTGRARARLLVPPASDPGLAGTTLFHAYLAGPIAGLPDFASNAVAVELVP